MIQNLNKMGGKKVINVSMSSIEKWSIWKIQNQRQVVRNMYVVFCCTGHCS